MAFSAVSDFLTPACASPWGGTLVSFVLAFSLLYVGPEGVLLL